MENPPFPTSQATKLIEALTPFDLYEISRISVFSRATDSWLYQVRWEHSKWAASLPLFSLLLLRRIKNQLFRAQSDEPPPEKIFKNGVSFCVRKKTGSPAAITKDGSQGFGPMCFEQLTHVPKDLSPDAQFYDIGPQKMAICFAKEIVGESATILAYDQGSNGAKGYVVFQSTNDFVSFAERLSPEQSHFYQVIEPDKPCHFYLDMDADTNINPTFNCTQALHIILDAFDKGFLQCFPGMDGGTWSIFSSHGKGKASFHAMHSRAVFENNNVVMKQFVEWVMDEHLSSEEDVYIVDRSRKHVCFLDLKVYTSYRVFRLAFQSKISCPGRTFVPYTGAEKESHGFCEDRFRASLVQPALHGILPFVHPLKQKRDEQYKNKMVFARVHPRSVGTSASD